MPRAAAKQAQTEPPIEQPQASELQIPQALEGFVDEMAWEVISRMFPTWVRRRIAYLLQSEDPAHVAKRQELFATLRDAIFAQALAGAATALPPIGAAATGGEES